MGAEPKPAAPRDVTIATADKLQISATFGAGRDAPGPGVVLIHDEASDRTSWGPAIGALRGRGIAVLVIDARGHGKSAKQGKTDLAPLAGKRDPKLFVAIHQDVIASVRWLAKEGGCDPKKIALVGAGLGGAIAMETSARFPAEVAAVVWLTPGLKYPGFDPKLQWKTVPKTLPMLLLAHRAELEEGAQELSAARPLARVVAYDEKAPSEAPSDRAWAHGTRLFAKARLVDRTIASFISIATGSKVDDVLIDGVVADAGPGADPWAAAASVAPEGSQGVIRAYRVGRRIVFGGTVPAAVVALRFEVQTGNEVHTIGERTLLGPPQIAAVDLGTGRVAWNWGGMSSMPKVPGIDASELFGKTTPALRVVKTEAGATFEGEWVIPTFGPSSELIHLSITPAIEIPAEPEGGMVSASEGNLVDLKSR